MNEKLKIFEQGWPSKDTVCGWSSTMENTENVRFILNRLLFEDLSIKSINDLGCGDLFWMKSVLQINPDISYKGYDCYRRASWDELEKQGYDLNVADITKDKLEPCDLTICRDVMIHLPNNMILDLLDNIKKCGTKFLFATNYIPPSYEEDFPKYSFSNFDRKTCPYIHHMKMDLREKPFYLGQPLRIVPENYPYKNMSLWRL